MANIDDLLSNNISLKDAAAAMIEDTLTFFDLSYTKMQSVPRDLLVELQTAALSLRFENEKDSIQMLSKLATKQGITKIDEIDEVLPLLFEHTHYKSYPPFLLETNQFDKMTTWLSKLTPHDLSKVDVKGCDSIHSWLDLLCEQTALDLISSSGTTGTMSFTPRDKSDWRTMMLGGFRIQLLQKFGERPSDDDLSEKLHVCWPSYADGHTPLFRGAQYFRKYFALDDEDYFHPMFNFAGDTDLMYLAARLRSAQSRGDSRVNVPQTLLDRRSEMEAMQKERGGKVADWMKMLVDDMAGKRVFLFGPPQFILDVCKLGLEQGKLCNFAPNSSVQAGGAIAGKGLSMPDDTDATIKKFMNFPGKYGYFYAFSEQTLMAVECEHGRLHLPPWMIPLILDPETSELLPREGVQVGRAAFFDLAINGVWGGLITGDKVEIDWSDCPCGRTTAHLGGNISRFSMEQGGSDKISCTATPEAHNDALDFLTSF